MRRFKIVMEIQDMDKNQSIAFPCGEAMQTIINVDTDFLNNVKTYKEVFISQQFEEAYDALADHFKKELLKLMEVSEVKE